MQMLMNTYNYIYGYNYFSLHTCSFLCLYKWDCCCSVTQLCLTLWDPTDCSMPGFLVLHYPPEFAQMQVHWVSDAIQPPHPLWSPSPPAFILSQHLRFLYWVGFSIMWPSIGASALASALLMNTKGWFPLGLTGLISLLSKGLSRVFSSTTIQKHQFFSAQPSLWSSSHIRTWLLENPNFDCRDFCGQSDVSVVLLLVD